MVIAHPFHEGPPVQLCGSVSVVRTAREPDAIHVVYARSRPSVEVIEFEAARLGTAITVLIHVRAAALVALENRVGDVARVGHGR